MVERVTIATEPTGATPPAPTPNPDRPEWLDPKFETPEAQAQAYAELQAKATRDAQELARLKGTPPAEDDGATSSNEATSDDAVGDEKPKTAEEKKDDAAKAAAEAAGIDLNPYSDEFARTGDVSAAGRAEIIDALAKSGTFKDLDVNELVNDYIEGKKATRANDKAMFMEQAGGEDNFGRMIEWAQTGWSKDQIAAFNRQVESGDRHATSFAITGLKADFEKAVGRDPVLLKGTGNPSGGSGVYSSVAEWQRDVRDPKYKTDPAFRDRVAAKLAASQI